MKLHNKLRASRIAQGLSLRDIERMSGHQISNPHVSQLERGIETKPSPHHLRVLAKVLKLDYLELMILAGYITFRDMKGKV
jgi:transcriptional regulator with XRE-family HTH domain